MNDKQTRIQKIIKERNAEFKYHGKSKDLYILPNGNALMVFGDAFTGADGVEDPGANHNMGTKEGLGHRNLEVSSYLFDEIEKKLKVPTQQVAVDLENDILEAKKVTMLGKGPFTVAGVEYVSGGLEFVGRNTAWGTYLQRYPGAKQGDDLRDRNGFPFTEVSIKNDDANDPFFTREEYDASGLATATDYNQGIQYTKEITKFLTEIFAQHGMHLVDIKMEFGKDVNGAMVLSDEISPGSLRATADGKLLNKEEIYKKLMGHK